MTNITGSKLSIFSHPGKITGYWISTISFPYQGQYGCLFFRCLKYVINRLSIHYITLDRQYLLIFHIFSPRPHFAYLDKNSHTSRWRVHTLF